MILLTNLQKVLDQSTVIDIPALEVKAGEVAALVGAVDSGKDILFQLLIGALRPTTGSVRLCGLDPYLERDAFSRRVGVLFSDDNLYKRMSVLGNLQFYSRLYRLPKTRPMEVLELVGLADQAHINAAKLNNIHHQLLCQECPGKHLGDGTDLEHGIAIRDAFVGCA